MAKKPVRILHSSVTKKLNDSVKSFVTESINCDTNVNPLANTFENRINRSLATAITELDPSDCMDGSCSTVEIPCIVLVDKYLAEDFPVLEGFAGSFTAAGGVSDETLFYPDGATLYQTYPTPEAQYDKWVESVKKVNKLFSGEDVEVTSIDSDTQGILSLCPRNTPTAQQKEVSLPQHYAGVNNNPLSLKAHFCQTKELGYFTGEQVWDEESQSLVDEYVTFRSIAKMYPNIQFKFLNRIKTEYILNGFFTNNSYGISIAQLYNYLGKNIPNIFNSEGYLYFPKNYPGMVAFDHSKIKENFYLQAHAIKKISAVNFDIGYNKPQSKVIVDDRQAYLNEGKHKIKIYNYGKHKVPETIFKNLAFTFSSTWIPHDASKWGANVNPAGENAIYGAANLPAGMFMHEVAHTMAGATHITDSMTIGGLGYLDLENTYITESLFGVFSETSRYGRNITVDPNTEELDFNLINGDFKPPFYCSVANPRKNKLYKDYLKADEDLTYWQTEVSEDEFNANNSITYQKVLDTYQQRKNNLYNTYSSVDEFYTAQYSGMDNEEKEYVEFFFNRLIPAYTNNFTSRHVFISGNSDGTTEARFEHVGPARSTEFNDPMGEPFANYAYTGIHSFWGGSYVFNNLPAVGDSYKGSIVTELYEFYTSGFRNVLINLEDSDKNTNALDEDDITTSFVVNPTDNQGNRIGPNVTSRVPFCVPGKDENGNIIATKVFDVTWLENFNSYNPEYPAYPPNTKLDDMLKEEYCPCLYETQTYYDGSESAYEYKIISSESTFENLQRLYYKFGRSYPVNAEGETSETPIYDPRYIPQANNIASTLLKTNINYFRNEFYSYVISVYNFSMPKSSRTCPVLHKYSDAQESLLTIMPAIGYYGFGYNTVLPYHYVTNKSVDNYSGKFEFPTKPGLRLGSPDPDYYTVSLQGTERTTGVSNPIYNTMSRYSLGSSDSESTLYNPLRQYYSKTLGLGKIVPASHPNNENNISQHQAIYSMPYYTGASINPLAFITDSSADYEELVDPSEQYYKDMYGEWSLENLQNIMSYPLSFPVVNHSIIPEEIVERINYYSNSNIGMYPFYKQLLEEDASAPVRLGDVYTDDSGFSGVIVNFNNTLATLLFTENTNNTKTKAIENAPSGTSLPTIFQWKNIKDNFDIAELSEIGLEEGKYWAHEDSVKYPGRSNAFQYDPENSISSNRAKLIDDDDNKYNNPVFASSNVKVAFVKNVQIPEHLISNEEPNFINDALDKFVDDVNTSKATDEIPGCMDPTAYNYESTATVNDGSCYPVIRGCMQEWSDNYSAPTGDPQIDVNTEDGSCTVRLCTDTEATGDFAAGYNQAAIDQALAYDTLQNLNISSIISAGNIVTNSLNPNDFSECQFTAQPIPTIIKTVCYPDPNSNLFSCNDNPVIAVLETADGSINAWSKDIVRKEYTLAQLEEKGVKVFGATRFEDDLFKEYFPTDQKVYDFSGSFFTTGAINSTKFDEAMSEYTSTPNPNTEIFYRLFARKLLMGSPTSGDSGVYNCVENPILPNGTGGCILYTSRFQDSFSLFEQHKDCSLTEITNTTKGNCNNTTIFSGGQLTDATILSQEFISIEGACDESTAQEYYIIPNVIEAGKGTFARVLKSSLPSYSSDQTNPITGYDHSLLNSDQIPTDVQSRSLRRSVSNREVNPKAVTTKETSEPIENISPTFFSGEQLFFTKSGQSYTGLCRYKTIKDKKFFYTYNQNTDTLGERIYQRNEVLRMFDVSPLDTEELAKKIYKITNKIINLTIFTDN